MKTVLLVLASAALAAVVGCSGAETAAIDPTVAAPTVALTPPTADDAGAAPTMEAGPPSVAAMWPLEVDAGPSPAIDAGPATAPEDAARAPSADAAPSPAGDAAPAPDAAASWTRIAECQAAGYTVDIGCGSGNAAFGLPGATSITYLGPDGVTVETCSPTHVPADPCGYPGVEACTVTYVTPGTGEVVFYVGTCRG